MKWNLLYKTQKLKRKVQASSPKIEVEKIIDILLKNRGIKEKKDIEAFINPTLKQLDKKFFDSRQLAKATKRIKKSINGNELIIVYSDYDADGITGTAILWETLRDIGANTLPYVPNRMIEGYGLSKKGIDNLLKKHPKTKLIVTVDNGITANEAVDYAIEKGLDIIITDHHVKPKKLPNAYAIVHTTELAGSGVALIFSHVLDNKLSDRSIGQLNNEHLAFATLGTVADLVPLTGSNRVIVKFGLEQLNVTKRLGLRALIEEIKIEDRVIGTYEIGFMIGPRINASGRLDHALDALRLLCTNNQARAWILATKLNKLNAKRKEMTINAIEHARKRSNDEQNIIIIADESYHEGVIGLVAGGLVDTFYRPSIVISKGKNISKASARSIKGFNIVEAIRTCSDILIDVGGHPMAAGFTIKTSKLAIFEKNLKDVIKKQLDYETLERKLRVDMELSLNRIDWDLYNAIEKLKPFGVGNPVPVFVSYGLEVIDATLVGRERSHLKLKVKQRGKRSLIFDAIAFGKGELYVQLDPDRTIDIAYTVSKNEWNGSTSLQLIIRDIVV